MKLRIRHACSFHDKYHQHHLLLFGMHLHFLFVPVHSILAALSAVAMSKQSPPTYNIYFVAGSLSRSSGTLSSSPRPATPEVIASVQASSSHFQMCQHHEDPHYHLDDFKIRHLLQLQHDRDCQLRQFQLRQVHLVRPVRPSF